MKTNTFGQKNTVRALAAILTAVPLLFGAHSAFAENTSLVQTTPVNETLAQSSIFCSRIDASTTELDGLISTGEKNYLEAKTTRKETLADSRAESDKALLGARAEADANYAEQYKLLTAQATTKSQKKAVIAFQKTITEAITKRRAAIDAAIKEYRSGVDQLLANKDKTYSAAVTSLKASIDTSMQVAKADCLASVAAGAQAESDTKINIRNARYEFAAAIKKIDTTAELDALTSTRDQALTKADTNFQSILESAGTSLKVSLGEK